MMLHYLLIMFLSSSPSAAPSSMWLNWPIEEKWSLSDDVFAALVGLQFIELDCRRSI